MKINKYNSAYNIRWAVLQMHCYFISQLANAIWSQLTVFLFLIWIRSHYFLQITSSSGIFLGCICTACYNLRFSLTFDICSGSFSCCRSQTLFSFTFLRDCMTFAFRLCWYLVVSIILSIHAMLPAPQAATPQRTIPRHWHFLMTFWAMEVSRWKHIIFLHPSLLCKQ